MNTNNGLPQEVELFMIVGGLLALVVIVIWVWSMLAIIDFSSNFKEFLEFYKQKENINYSSNSSTALEQGEVEKLQDDNTERDRSEQVSEKGSRSVYWLVGIVIVLLLVALGVVIEL